MVTRIQNIASRLVLNFRLVYAAFLVSVIYLPVYLLQVMDIILHCVDPGHLKARGLNEVFPAICIFNQVSHCPTTRRIAVGAKNGSIALYELRSSKSQCQVCIIFI